MRVIRAKDFTDMSRKAACILAAQVVGKPCSVIGLATGDSPLGIYSLLAEWHSAGYIDFSQAVTVNLDEYRGLPPDSVHSYRYFMETNLFSKININPVNTHVPAGLAEDTATECARYDAVIESAGGIDLQLLGIGFNGHIGFNEPSGSFIKNTHIADLTENTMLMNSRHFDCAGDVPVQAYTVGIKPIIQARRILLIASGTEKARIIRQAFYGDITPAVPASILQLHPDLTVVGDEAALSLI